MMRAVAVTCAVLTACLPYAGEVEGDDVPVAAVVGTIAPRAGASTDAVSVEFPVALDFTSFDMTAQVLHLSALRLVSAATRTATPQELAQPNGLTDAQINDLSRIGPCLEGQPSLDFIDTIDLYVQRGPDTATRLWLAHGANAFQPTCGLALVPTTGTTDAPQTSPAVPSVFGLSTMLDSARIIVAVRARLPSSEVAVVATFRVDYVLSR